MLKTLLPAKRKLPFPETSTLLKSPFRQLTLTTEKPPKSNGNGIFESPEIHIGCWNVNGLRACLKKQTFLDFLAQDRFDIFCFNETKLQESMTTDLKDNFPQYKYQYWSCSRVKKGYSGVAILSKIEPISVKPGIDKRKHDDEGRVLTAEYETFYLVCSYIPNAGEGLVRLQYRVEEWDKDLKEYLKNLEKTGKSVIWIGDLNVVHQELDIHSFKGNEKCPGCTIEERSSFSATLNDGLVDTFRSLYPNVRKYTWFSQRRTDSRIKNRGWRLDYAIVSANFLPRVKDHIIYDTIMGSDHHPIELIISNNKI
ncbi:unnamed protein product [Blepharisma stoltei]|uniref:Endonuclease/exonuclease/phosphatase domain-containing protein n=1 Tax=Blepharisma stoltei TaxID=1481888 RepID=A0AAU9IHT9_9CILI|nr:unnamed protein product [Blepharisma stoltei]